MMKTLMLAASLAVAAGLAGCEKPQSLVTYKGDVPAYQGAPNSPNMTTGWTPGDKKSWESALKARMQNSQNEYPKSITAK
jgi:outer membrane protein assembly factor BamE (lipoprotein component of BamABCDE complex)